MGRSTPPRWQGEPWSAGTPRGTARPARRRRRAARPGRGPGWPAGEASDRWSRAHSGAASSCARPIRTLPASSSMGLSARANGARAKRRPPRPSASGSRAESRLTAAVNCLRARLSRSHAVFTGIWRACAMSRMSLPSRHRRARAAPAEASPRRQRQRTAPSSHDGPGWSEPFGERLPGATQPAGNGVFMGALSGTAPLLVAQSTGPRNRGAPARSFRRQAGDRRTTGTARVLVKGDFPCGGPEAPAISFAAPTGWDGTCTSVNAVEGSRESSPASVLRGELFADARPPDDVHSCGFSSSSNPRMDTRCPCRMAPSHSADVGLLLASAAGTMRIAPTVAAIVSLHGVALCAASCVMHPSETFSEAEIDMPTSAPEAGNMTLDGGAAGGSTTETEAIGTAKTIRCKRHEHGADCMMRCADAGISCPAGRKHPYKDNVKTGLLWQCRSLGLASSCWYYYKNGDMCVFLGRVPVKCRYERWNS